MITRAERDSAKAIVEAYDKQQDEIKYANIDKGLGLCKHKNCNKFATTDYNGHGHFVCKFHDEVLEREFEDEFD